MDGGGVRGACLGDSGGPLLAGVPAMLVGVLSGGSLDCVGIDRYERLDTLTTWIDDTIERAASDPCRGLGWEGRCVDGGAIWCDSGRLVLEDCIDKQMCGYRTSESAFRCLDGPDPCEGIGREAQCMDDWLVRCRRGELLRENCADCGKRCTGQAGGAACL